MSSYVYSNWSYWYTVLGRVVGATEVTTRRVVLGGRLEKVEGVTLPWVSCEHGVKGRGSRDPSWYVEGQKLRTDKIPRVYSPKYFRNRKIQTD